MSELSFYHSPNTRSTGARVLLEELGAPYTLHALDMKAGEQRAASYLAVNPMGKVPAILHDGALVTEQVAVYLYLADLFPEAGLAPAIGDPLRGPYLRWFAYYGSCFEPAMVDKAMKREAGPTAMSPYGDFDTVVKVVADQVRPGPWFLGERFTALDVLWGGALGWMMMFGLSPNLPEFEAYVARVRARPAHAKVEALDQELAARQEAARDKAGA
jgi:glutathione S-transferase